MESLSDYFSQLVYGSTDSEEVIDDDRSREKLKSDADAGNPNKAWRKRAKLCTCEPVTPLDPKSPVKENHVRFVCISDTHTKLEQFRNLEIPDGDVLLHAGDFSMNGIPDEVDVVNKYLGTLPHKYKVVIAGNHDKTFDLDYVKKNKITGLLSLPGWNYESGLQHFGVKTVHEMLTDCIYLQDSMVEIYGIKIYGTPWTVGRGFWGFQRPRGPGLMKKWNQIPTDTDILLSHSPPCGYGDNVNVGVAYKLKRLAGGPSEDHVGCVDLLNTVQTRVKPKYHVYGHIHEGYGIRTDGTTTFINASTCTHSYDPTNPAIVFDVPLPEGYSKTQNDKDIKKTKDICSDCKNTANNCNEGVEFLEESDNDSSDDLSDFDEFKAESANGNETNGDLDCGGFLNTVDEEDEYFLDSIETNSKDESGFSTESASKKDDEESGDEDSDIVFDSEENRT
ncbi:metallophosphoesterase MPPED2-like isoform X2 [Mercenaria mercenaria]|nr:metallophosphoesterase MPPED2-like isoform X2 [Mercenaria mercenaria]